MVLSFSALLIDRGTGRKHDYIMMQVQKTISDVELGLRVKHIEEILSNELLGNFKLKFQKLDVLVNSILMHRARGGCKLKRSTSGTRSWRN